MPELTVAMPARDSERFVATAIASILAQQGVDFELVVVDDGSLDDTAAVVRGFGDPRVRLLTNPKPRGIAACHNRILDESDSRFVAHVDSDDLILAGALRKLVDAVARDPSVGQAHCHFFHLDTEGRVELAAYRRLRSQLLARRGRDLDYRRELSVGGTVINCLRTYRREALRDIGRFNETLRFDVDHEMGLRIADCHRFALVPEFLYGIRLHDANTTESLRWKSLRFFGQRVAVWRAILGGERDHFLKHRRLALARLMAVRAWRLLGLHGPSVREEDPGSLELPSGLRPGTQPGFLEVVIAEGPDSRSPRPGGCPPTKGPGGAGG